jgi:formate dehydrogenase subunit beta
MAEFTKLSFKKGEMNTALAGLFKDMIGKGAAEAVLTPATHPNRGVMQTLISDPDRMNIVDPFAPVVPLNSAKIASSLTAKSSGRPVAMVMRSCEIRALIELVKLNQANLDDVILIGLDCMGRYENEDFLKFQEQGGTTESFLERARSGETASNGIDITQACKICEHPVADNVDIRLCAVGLGPDDIYVEWVTEKGQAMFEKMGLQAVSAPGKRTEAVDKLTKARTDARQQLFKDFRESTNSFETLQDLLAGCINCYNCRVACPVCYCKECVFVTDTFRHSGDQFMGWANRDGALIMPTDTVFYHLTRLIHMSALCVGCGQCTSACPNGINLMPLFRSVAEKTQMRFDYEAGRSLEDEQPMEVFYDDELMEVTGQVK